MSSIRPIHSLGSLCGSDYEVTHKDEFSAFFKKLEQHVLDENRGACKADSRLMDAPELPADVCGFVVYCPFITDEGREAFEELTKELPASRPNPEKHALENRALALSDFVLTDFANDPAFDEEAKTHARNIRMLIAHGLHDATLEDMEKIRRECDGIVIPDSLSEEYEQHLSDQFTMSGIGAVSFFAFMRDEENAIGMSVTVGGASGYPGLLAPRSWVAEKCETGTDAKNLCKLFLKKTMPYADLGLGLDRETVIDIVTAGYLETNKMEIEFAEQNGEEAPEMAEEKDVRARVTTFVKTLEQYGDRVPVPAWNEEQWERAGDALYNLCCGYSLIGFDDYEDELGLEPGAARRLNQVAQIAMGTPEGVILQHLFAPAENAKAHKPKGPRP